MRGLEFDPHLNVCVSVFFKKKKPTRGNKYQLRYKRLHNHEIELTMLEGYVVINLKSYYLKITTYFNPD